jgi:type II secretory pathway component PulF
VASARFARTFGQLTRSGVLILNALEIVSGATGNKVAGKVIMDARAAVEKGEPLSSAMVNQTVFPLLLVRMLQAGEKTGKIDEMMDSMIDDFDVLEEEGDQAVKAVVSQLLKGKLPDGYVPEVTLHLDDAAENELREHIASEYSGQKFVKEMEES